MAYIFYIGYHFLCKYKKDKQNIIHQNIPPKSPKLINDTLPNKEVKPKPQQNKSRLKNKGRNVIKQTIIHFPSPLGEGAQRADEVFFLDLFVSIQKSKSKTQSTKTFPQLTQLINNTVYNKEKKPKSQ